jgi:heptaprenyl diphosphate synthase
MLSYQTDASENKELFSLVTSLVQMGLDTHEMVENAPAAEGLAGMRSRQLQVLAGDYFSSRFYQLLSQAGQIEMIRKLSEAICDLNRIKMSFYLKMKQMKLNAEEYVNHGAELRSGLFMSFSHLMTGLYGRLWPDLLDRFSRCELLMQELARIERSGRLAESWGVWHILEEGDAEDREQLALRRDDTGFIRQLLEKYGVEGKLGGLLRQSVQQLQSLVQRLQSDRLARDLQPLLEPFVKAAGLVPAAAMKDLG